MATNSKIHMFFAVNLLYNVHRGDFMEPTYIYGEYPTKLKIIACLLILFFFPVVIANWIEYACTSFGNTTVEIPFIILYLIGFFILLVLFTNSRNRRIYLFYNSFLLYKEPLSIKDKVVLAFINKDLEKLENYLEKYQYRNINTLSINYDIQNMMKFDETGITIYIDLNYSNGDKTRIIPIATKEDYRQFLAPFLQHQIPIIDPHHIVDAINQEELRIIDYLGVNKKST